MSIKVFAEKEMEQKMIAQQELAKRKKADEEKEKAKEAKRAKVEADKAWEVRNCRYRGWFPLLPCVGAAGPPLLMFDTHDRRGGRDGWTAGATLPKGTRRRRRRTRLSRREVSSRPS